MTRGVPYDAEIEYLECAGTSSAFPYINTGIVGDSNTEYEAMIRKNTQATNECAIGSWNSGDTRCWIAYYVGDKFYLGMGANVTSAGTPQPNVWYKQTLKIKSSNFNLYIDDELIATVPQTTFTSNQPLYIGAMNSSGMASYYFRGRFGAMKIYQNGNLVRDFIPVRVGTTGYLYDRVSKKLFGNLGTGDFVLGPDKAVPILSLHRYAAPTVTEWVDGWYWDTWGVATLLAGASRCDNFIPVQPSSTVTFYLGYRPGGTTLYMVQYNADKERVNSTYNSQGAARTVTIPANCYYIRISCETANKTNVYVHDDTNDKYLMKDGRVLVADATGRTSLGKMGCTKLFHRITAKDYVQSGLVAMWDGIENTGGGS